jgi:hypothetical protein
MSSIELECVCDWISFHQTAPAESPAAPAESPVEVWVRCSYLSACVKPSLFISVRGWMRGFAHAVLLPT